jgi:hypothetical protein
MEQVTLTYATLLGLVGLFYTSLKEKQEQAKSLGKLEEKVASLEAKQQTLHELVEALQETKIAVARLETKIDALLGHRA